MARLEDLVRFYEILARLQAHLGQPRTLGECTSTISWPTRGVYFFFENGEHRSHTGVGPRVVRVGTHALTESSKTTLWNRLSQHRGVEKSGSGAHRGSIFRLIVGAAQLRRDGRTLPSWGLKSDMGAAAKALGVDRSKLKQDELPIEVKVSAALRAMHCLWLAVDDAPGAASERGIIERGAIGLLSNYGRDPLDPPSETWLGLHSDRERVRLSGLWNNNHVDETHDASFLAVMERRVDAMIRAH